MPGPELPAALALAEAEGLGESVADGGGAFRQRIVELGGSGGELIEIRAGLTAGEVVAVDGAFLLKSELLR